MIQKNSVAVETCLEYDPVQIRNVLNKVVQETDFPDVQGKKVLVKPNMLSASEPEKAVTTHPEVLRALLQLLNDKKAGKVYVGDSPGIGSSEAAGKKTGIKAVCQDEGAHWIIFDQETRVSAPHGKKQKQFYLASVLEEVDVLITLPKMKTHGMMYMTGAVKNLFGLVPGLKKSRFHFNYPEKSDFAGMIVDLLDTVKPDFALMDGIWAMEGPGPGNGYPRHCGYLLASANAAALDIAAARIMGYVPERIPIFKEIMDRGEWLQSPEDISYPLLSADDLVIKDFKRIHVLKDTGFIKNKLSPGVYKFLHNLYVPRPFFKVRPCITCRKCIDICPADALSLNTGPGKKKIDIKVSDCIRCYCCHEVCPVDAIRLGRL